MMAVQIPRRFVTTRWGGTETVILETARRLPALGCDNEVFTTNALCPVSREAIEGVRVRRFGYFYPYLGLRRSAKAQLDNKGGNLFSFSLLAGLNRLPGLDLIHLHTMKRLGGIGRHVARRRGIPYVVSLHGGAHDVPAEEARTWTEPTAGAFEWGRALGWWVGSRQVLDEAAAIICVGREEQRRTQVLYPDRRVVHLPNGVDTGRFATGDGRRFRQRFGIPAAARLLLNVGRIDPQKNQRFALRVLDRVRRECPQAHLALAGHVTSEPYHADLVREIGERGLTGHVTIVPGLDPRGHALADAYHAADLFLLPSVHEPFGIVILEAWAAGRPVIAARVGGVTSLVEDGEDGLLFDSMDERTCGALASDVLARPGLAARLGQAGRDKAEREYSWEQVTRRLFRLYEEVIRERAVRQ